MQNCNLMKYTDALCLQRDGGIISTGLTLTGIQPYLQVRVTNLDIFTHRGGQTLTGYLQIHLLIKPTVTRGKTFTKNICYIGTYVSRRGILHHHTNSQLFTKHRSLLTHEKIHFFNLKLQSYVTCRKSIENNSKFRNNLNVDTFLW
jgi:hypothetical protein